MAQVLKVHPAFVAAYHCHHCRQPDPESWGILIAAPLLATLQLIVRYTVRKLLDRFRPPEEDVLPPPSTPKWLQKWPVRGKSVEEKNLSR